MIFCILSRLIPQPFVQTKSLGECPLPTPRTCFRCRLADSRMMRTCWIVSGWKIPSVWERYVAAQLVKTEERCFGIAESKARSSGSGVEASEANSIAFILALFVFVSIRGVLEALSLNVRTVRSDAKGKGVNVIFD